MVNQCRSWVSCIGQPVVLLIIRFWMGTIFWLSGMTKIADMDNAVALFTNIYQLPLVSPVMAAYIAAAVEIGAAVMLFAGFFTRMGALLLLMVTMVIQFVLGSQDPSFYTDEHFLWMIMLGALICFGGGMISIDHCWCQYCSKKDSVKKPQAKKGQPKKTKK